MLEGNELLEVWEAGAAGSHTHRGLLLHAASTGSSELDMLAKVPVGTRDAALLSLHEALFGTQAECVTVCEVCSEPLELSLDLCSLHLPTDRSGEVHTLHSHDHDLRFRALTGGDLSTLEGVFEVDVAVSRLLERCIIEASDGHGPVPPAALPPDAVTALSQRLSELDPQAEIVLELACAACRARQQRIFDIVELLWARVDALARTLLLEVHTLASAYGWSEAHVLGMSAARRRAYLSLCGAE